MRNFVITLLVLSTGMWIADSVFADTLYGLYSDNTAKQTTTTTKHKKTKSSNNLNQYNNTYMPNYSNDSPMKTLSGNADELMKKGSPNYGQYAITNKRTNPLRFDNPYNKLNDKKITTPAQAATSTVTFDGDAVKFKKGADGNLYGYNKYGKKIGVYRVNANGTTTQYDTQGNRMGTFK